MTNQPVWEAENRELRAEIERLKELIREGIAVAGSSYRERCEWREAAISEVGAWPGFTLRSDAVCPACNGRGWVIRAQNTDE